MALHRIIIDCDPGQDDAVALLLALASPDEIEVLAVTAVAGNVPLALTEANARRIVELAGRPDIRVHKGCHRPLVKRLETAEYVHGETGLNGVELPPPSHPLAPGHAVDAIIELVMAAEPKTVTLCPVGPLTNIAMALVKEPALAARLCQIVLMGGAIGLGNVTPAAEFNIYVDPHAARVVFESGVPITMFGLDVTHQVLVTRPRLEAIRSLGTKVALAAAGLIDFFNRFDSDRYEVDGAPLHDPCVIAHLIDPTLFKGKPCHVEIETEGRSMGRTNVDWHPREQRPATATVMNAVDADRFFALLTERLGRL
ncbi:MAG: nucleoside hydrolase [Geminicoccaceae bacterium]|jgi:purine nucleosidase|nr:nucleoside hydrolase [Geminicoccaceae bacterium]HRY25227.1 nucleoside hydrolase [Geminicoccaceae bacterium]